MFNKILIANRGEIAVRVIRACRQLGITSVAVFSEVDRAALHVRMADEAYPIGPAAATESYLNIPRIMDAVRHSRADAIHPGYGFLSENPRFAEACMAAGVKFIGPSSRAMEMMASKTRARKRMEQAGVPFVPGTVRPLPSLEETRRIAGDLGYPVMLKAAAGGGGKGMRLVHEADELASALEAARSEAERAFGDDEVYIEKAIVNPRHIEMQVLGDEHGHTVWLGERECSIQRRHQKVLEEAPSPLLDEDMRCRMGEVAVRVARAAEYSNAGTVEFLVDENKDFYFLEMNTRLQVEHPITELITGLDLVELQIRIATGEELPFRQQDVHIRGHAIECRVYAEDPDKNYFPSPGRITLLLSPSGPGIRVDSGVYEGWNVPIEYDALLAKLVGYGSDRGQTIHRLRRALNEYFVGGITTNLSLFERILDHPEFQAGRQDTGFLDRLLAQSRSPGPTSDGAEIAALAAGVFELLDGAAAASSVPLHGGRKQNGEAQSSWKQAGRREALKTG